MGIYAQSFAQQDFQLQLQSGVFILDERKSVESAMQESPSYLGQKFLILQFDNLPDDSQKQSLEGIGIKLLNYLPENAWICSVNEQMNLRNLSEFQLNAISPFLPLYKLSSELAQKIYPKHALMDNGIIALQVHCLKTGSASGLSEFLLELGYRNLENTNYEYVFKLEIEIARIEELLKVPFVQFVSPIEPPKQDEKTWRNTVGRANFISSGINGLNFNGEGITLGIEESGIIDPENINFKGRKIENTADIEIGGHKTGCAENAGGAGNLDPKFLANAWGANIMSLKGTTWNYYNTEQLRMASHSYGWGISGGYWSGAADHDEQIRLQKSMMHFYSSGNLGSDTCNYGTYKGLVGWSNITGGSKQAKNIMTICNTDPRDELTFGSVGPTYDGRIKPDVCIEGSEGTSFSSPKAAGIMAQLYQVWRSNHGGNYPNSGLIKAFMMNTADDLFTPGPDFKTGFGRLNVRRAYNAIVNNQFFADSINVGGNKTHTIMVPDNVKELRIMLYWNDYQATANAAFALINNLNASLIPPSGPTLLPWILNTSPHKDSLDNPAIRGIDKLNNVEQITIKNPAAGSYAFDVSGFSVPQSNQLYFVVYEFLFDELTLTYPIGKEYFVAGENEIIRWDNYGYDASSEKLDIDFSQDNGAIWTNVVQDLPNTATNYEWKIPEVLTGKAKIRITRGALESSSLLSFNIAPTVKNISSIWSCGDSAMLQWDVIPNATGYLITRLGQNYMDSIGVSSSPYFKVKNLDTNSGEWFSVQSKFSNNATSRRAIAWKWTQQNSNCIPKDAFMKKIFTYQEGFYPDCYAGIKRPLKFLIQNRGTSDIINAEVSFQINNGTVYKSILTGTLGSADEFILQSVDSVSFTTPGTYMLKAWVNIVDDQNPLNDTLVSRIVVHGSESFLAGYTQDFEDFTKCSTDWGCESEICGLTQGWFNVPNIPTTLGDSIDWRTTSGPTGTGDTGPDFDHTLGNNSGKYLYLETSSDDGGGCRRKQANLQSVCWDLRNTNQAELSYWYHAFGSNIGSLQVDILGENGWEEEIIPTQEGDKGNIWINNKVNLEKWRDQIVVVRFVGKSGDGYRGDLAIDDINLSSFPTAVFQVLAPKTCTDSVISIQNNSSFSNTFSWKVSPNDGVTFLNGSSDTSSAPSLSFTKAGNYNIELIATNTNGNDTLAQSITILAPPTDAIMSTLDTSICAGASLSLFVEANGSTPFNYAWFLQGKPLVNFTDSLQLNNLNELQSGLYNCQLSNICGNTDVVAELTVNPLPVIDLGNDTTLFVNGPSSQLLLNAGSNFSNYQWNADSSNTQSSYLINGNEYATGSVVAFTVQVTNEYGCVSMDTIEVSFLFNVATDNKEDTRISIYPNPASELIYVNMEGMNPMPDELILYNQLGKKIWSYLKPTITPYPINIKNLAAGSYLLQAKWSGKVLWAKVQIVR